MASNYMNSFRIKELLLLGGVFLIVVSSIGIGFYTLLKSNQAATVNLKATAQATANTRTTVTSSSTATMGPLIFADSLSRNTQGRWNESATCVFQGGTYHALIQKADSTTACLSKTLTFNNAAIQADVSLISGTMAGLVFRVTNDSNKGYRFYMFVISQRVFLFTRLDSTGNKILPLREGISTFSSGNAKNTMLVMANGNDFKLYINATLVGQVQDSGILTAGQLGFIGGTSASVKQGEASFSNLKVFSTNTTIAGAYPDVAGLYQGSAYNTTANIKSDVSFSIEQQGKTISGYWIFFKPLAGQGPLTGAVDTTGYLQFTVQSNLPGVSLSFKGKVQPDGSLKGTYIVSNGQVGNWSATLA